MFDHVTFTGTVNLGAIVTVITSILSSYAILIRVRALVAEHDFKSRLPGGRRKDDPPLPPLDPPFEQTDGKITIEK